MTEKKSETKSKEAPVTEERSELIKQDQATDQARTPITISGPKRKAKTRVPERLRRKVNIDANVEL
jgi:hypothetical protein